MTQAPSEHHHNNPERSGSPIVASLRGFILWVERSIYNLISDPRRLIGKEVACNEKHIEDFLYAVYEQVLGILYVDSNGSVVSPNLDGVFQNIESTLQDLSNSGICDQETANTLNYSIQSEIHSLIEKSIGGLFKLKMPLFHELEYTIQKIRMIDCTLGESATIEVQLRLLREQITDSDENMTLTVQVVCDGHWFTEKGE